jgi:hypothetical protein
MHDLIHPHKRSDTTQHKLVTSGSGHGRLTTLTLVTMVTVIYVLVTALRLLGVMLNRGAVTYNGASHAQATAAEV